MPFKLTKRPAGPGHQLATAIGADALKYALSASDAERALKGTNYGFRGLRRQIGIAAFATRSKLKHAHPFLGRFWPSGDISPLAESGQAPRMPRTGHR